MTLTYYSYPGLVSNKYIPINMTHEMRLEYANSIIKTVADFYGIEVSDMKGKTRLGDLPYACQIASYYIKEKIPMLRLTQIAELFGKRYLLKDEITADHTAIIYNYKCVKGWLKINDDRAKDVLTIKNLL